MLDKVEKILINSDDHHMAGRVVYMNPFELIEDSHPDNKNGMAAYLYLDKEYTIRASADEMEELFLKKCFIKSEYDYKTYGYVIPNAFNYMVNDENVVMARITVLSGPKTLLFYNKETDIGVDKDD